MPDYTEILCQSIDNIVKKRISEVKFNSIKCYRVINILDAQNGKYELIDGDMRFIAYTLDGSVAYYEINDWVYVLIPNNDFSENKFILSIKHMEGEEN